MRPQSEAYEKSDHLRCRACDGQEEAPAFWLRGVTPRKWTCPEPCDTEADEKMVGFEKGERIRDDQVLIVCGDGSGGSQSSDARYRRCGWGWALVRDVNGIHTVAAAASGPLPGPRQTNNRAELAAFISALQCTAGPMEFWTDSEILCKGWRNRRYEKRNYAKGNGDLWRTIGKELQERGGRDEVIVHHIQSHLSQREAASKGYPERAWYGNQKADELAGHAADSHQIAPQQLQCYEWVRAVSSLVRNRIAQAMMDSFKLNPPLTWEEKKELKKKAAKLKPKAATLEELAKQSQHLLDKTKNGWQCRRCNQNVTKDRATMARWWLMKPCAEPEKPQPQRQKGSIVLKGRASHSSHDMKYSKTQSKYYCFNCGGTGVTILSKKLSEICKGKPKDKQLWIKLQRIRNQA